MSGGYDEIKMDAVGAAMAVGQVVFVLWVVTLFAVPILIVCCDSFWPELDESEGGDGSDDGTEWDSSTVSQTGSGEV